MAMKNMGKISDALRDMSAKRDAGVAPVDVNQVTRGSKAARSLGHRLNMLTSMMMSVGSGNPEEMELHAAYWKEVVDIISKKMLEWYPEKRGELRPDEIGMLENSTRLIARDGIRSGATPSEFLAPFLREPFFDSKQSSFVDNPQQTETVFMMFSNLKGIEQVSRAIHRFMREFSQISDNKLENVGISRGDLLEVITGGNSVEAMSKVIYAEARKNVQVIARHLAEEYQDPTIANQATISNFASTIVEHLDNRSRLGFNDFFIDTMSKWADPMMQDKMLSEGALPIWMKGEVEHACHRMITVFDSSEDYIQEGLKMTNPELLEKAKRFQSTISNVDFGSLAQKEEPPKSTEISEASDSVDLPKKPVIQARAGTFAERLAKSGVSVSTKEKTVSGRLDSVLKAPTQS